MKTNEPLLCGYQLVSTASGCNYILRGQTVMFTGSYAECKEWAREHRLLQTQAPSRQK